MSHLLDLLQEAGIREIGVVVDSRDGPLTNWPGWRRRPGVKFAFFEQSLPLGTAHCLKVAQGYVGTGPFLVVCGDCFLDGSLRDFVEWSADGGHAVSILVTSSPDPHLYGVIEMKGDRVTRVAEKPARPAGNNVMAGVYVFDKRIFPAIDVVKPSPRHELELTGAIQIAIERGLPVGAYTFDGYWRDLGRPEDILHANRYVLDRLEPENVPDFPRSHLEGRVSVGNRARVINSTIIGPVSVGEGSAVINSWVGPFTSIGSHSVVEDCELEGCVVMNSCRLRGVGRLEGGVIGDGNTITRRQGRPEALRMVLGEGNRIELP
jgi:glucose-1-phosphate thymidylyltransferase